MVCMALLTGILGGHAQWFNQVSAVPDNLYGVHFVNRDTGYAVGGSLNNSRILRTFNGGTDWQNVSLSQSKWMYDVQFINDSTGLVCGYNGVVYKTTDFGDNWNPIPSETTEWLYAIHYLNKDTVFMAGMNGTILRSVNGGNNWTPMSTGSATWLLDIAFCNDTLGYACGESGKIYRTTNTGNTWEMLTNGVSTQTLNALVIINPDSIFAVGNSGTILLSADSGATWVSVVSNTSAQLQSIHFVSSSHGYIVGETILLQTANGGASWVTVTSPVTTGLDDICTSPDATTAYAVGKSGTIIKNDLTTGIEEPQESPALLVYPNPFARQVVVTRPDADPSVEGVILADMYGRTWVLSGADQQLPLVLDLGEWPAGIYYLRLLTHDGLLVKKLMKVD